MNGNAEAVGSHALPATESAFIPLRTGYLRLKRVLDVVLGLILLAVTAPITAIAALLVKATSKGPMFYSQERLGKDGRPFTIYKVRTMIQDAEKGIGAVWCATHDPRITTVGMILRATHIDEFPQLINVLRGEMSLVGPRPERPEISSKLEWEIPFYNDRLRVLPGITGLAQLRLPPDTDLEGVRRKTVHDLYYVRHVSFWLDARLFFLTGWSLVRELTRLASKRLGLPTQQTIERDYRHIAGQVSDFELPVGPAPEEARVVPAADSDSELVECRDSAE